jgi:hypothetical protein
MEHAINHFLVFENFLKWLFHTFKYYFLVVVWNSR